MKRIAIDMDEVITDATGRHIEWYAEEFGQVIDRSSFHGKRFYMAVPEEHRDTVRAYPHREGFFKDMTMMEGARDVILDLSKEYEIFVVTAAMEFRNSFVHKYDWLQEHLDFISWKNYVFCGDKSIIEADYLIDDLEKNLKPFKGEPLLFTATHNMNLKDYPRYNNWQEIRAKFLS